MHRRGRLARFMSLVSLICLLAAIFYIVPASTECDRIRRVVYVFNDVPASLVLKMLRPWAESSTIYWRMRNHFIEQRLVIADVMAKQFYGQPNYRFMCTADSGRKQK